MHKCTKIDIHAISSIFLKTFKSVTLIITVFYIKLLCFYLKSVLTIFNCNHVLYLYSFFFIIIYTHL